MTFDFGIFWENTTGCTELIGYDVFPGAQPAHDVCFEDVNAAGNAFGNCGKDEHGNYVKCKKR